MCPTYRQNDVGTAQRSLYMVYDYVGGRVGSVVALSVLNVKVRA